MDSSPDSESSDAATNVPTSKDRDEQRRNTLTKLAPLVLFAAIFANANLNAKNIFGFALKGGIDAAAVFALCLILRSFLPQMSTRKLLLLAVPMYVVFQAFPQKIFKGIKYALKLGMSVPKTMTAIVAVILAALGVRAAARSDAFQNVKLDEFFQKVAVVVSRARASKPVERLLEKMSTLLSNDSLGSAAAKAFAPLQHALSKMQASFPSLFPKRSGQGPETGGVDAN